MTPRIKGRLGSGREWLVAFATAISSAAAIFAYVQAGNADKDADRASKAQQAFAAEVEERESAPVLAPDVEPSLQGDSVTVATAYGTIEKQRAERLFVSKTGQPQIIMPVRNVGSGLAIIPVTVAFPRACPSQPTGEPPVLESRVTKYLGPYNVPPGESRQLAFAPLRGESSRPYLAARTATRLSLMVLYTDLLGRRLRWTCVDYTRPTRGDSWSVEYPYYGDRERRTEGRSG
jgi:hypothetical protein